MLPQAALPVSRIRAGQSLSRQPAVGHQLASRLPMMDPAEHLMAVSFQLVVGRLTLPRPSTNRFLQATLPVSRIRVAATLLRQLAAGHWFASRHRMMKAASHLWVISNRLPTTGPVSVPSAMARLFSHHRCSAGLLWGALSGGVREIRESLIARRASFPPAGVRQSSPRIARMVLFLGQMVERALLWLLPVTNLVLQKALILAQRPVSPPASL
jgi:hypothetical protein